MSSSIYGLFGVNKFIIEHQGGGLRCNLNMVFGKILGMNWDICLG